MSRVNVEEKWPVLARHERAAEWLRIWTDLGRAPRTIDAYARGLAEYLQVCERDGIDPLAANRAQVALFVRELSDPTAAAAAPTWSRWTPGSGWRTPRCSSGWCRCGCSTTSSSRRACESPTRSAAAATPLVGSSAAAARPLVPRMVKLPWIPAESEWRDCWRRSAGEPIRNRLMLALAYDAALRREELCSLRTDDLDPGAPHAAGPGGDDQDPPGAGGALLGADRRAAGGATCATAARSAGPGARCSCRSRGATTPSR